MEGKNRKLYLDETHRLWLEEEEIPTPGPGEVLVKIFANGICGSDVHFYHEGKLGVFTVDRPYVPGHEASGTVAGLGEGAKRFQVGDKVVVEPGIPCGRCKSCKEGRYNLCPDVVFLSAPPIDGTFCDYITIDENFLFPVPGGLSMELAALAEPAAVAIHAANRAHFRAGDTGVIVGAGPIGLLTLQAFKAAGGGQAICVDLIPSRLELAKKLGADRVWNPSTDGEVPSELGEVVFETAGSSVTTAQLFRIARRGGKVVQVGWPNGNVVALDVAMMMDKEIDYIGLNRYANVFDTALTWLADGRIGGEALITQRFSLKEAPAAFDWALNHAAETVKVMVLNG
ncbi:MAG: alcohol dehydrogenase catalytic domain-containing protein [Oscillospiraceae bacterium]